MTHRGRPVDPAAIRRTALLTIEGENDDISGVGQTEAAHALCSNIPEARRMHHVQERVGHYGIFNGSRFRRHIVPRVVGFMADHATAAARGDAPADPIQALEGNQTPAARRRKAEAPMPGPDAPASVAPGRRTRKPAAKAAAEAADGTSNARAKPANDPGALVDAEADKTKADETKADETKGTKAKGTKAKHAPARSTEPAAPVRSIEPAASPPAADNANARAAAKPTAGSGSTAKDSTGKDSATKRPTAKGPSGAGGVEAPTR